MSLVAIVVQLLAIAAIHFSIGTGLSLFVVIALLAGFNLLSWWRMRSPRPAGDIELFYQLLVAAAVFPRWRHQFARLVLPTDAGGRAAAILRCLAFALALHSFVIPC